MSNNQFNLTFETELNEGIRVTTLSPVFCSGDNEAHSFIVKAMRNGKPVSLSGATVRGFFIRPDNVTITLDGTVNADGDAVVTLSDSCYYKQGRFQIVIRATIDGVASTLFCGIGGMLLASTDSFIDEGNIVPSLDDLLAQIDAMKEATAAALEAAARANEAAENAGSGGSYPVVGYVDADNNIILTSDDLAAGTYTFKYENADGTQTNIGTAEVGSTDESGDETTYNNVLASAIGYNGTVLNDVGYVDGYYLSSSANVSGNNSYLSTSADATHFVTGFIPYAITDWSADFKPIYVKGITLDLSSIPSHSRFAVYPTYTHTASLIPMPISDLLAADKAMAITQLGDNYYKIQPQSNLYSFSQFKFDTVGYIRMSLPGSGEGVIITVDEPIE